MFRFVGHVGAKVAPHDAVPREAMLLVEFLLDERGDVLRKPNRHEMSGSARAAATTTRENTPSVRRP